MKIRKFAWLLWYLVTRSMADSSARSARFWGLVPWRAMMVYHSKRSVVWHKRAIHAEERALSLFRQIERTP